MWTSDKWFAGEVDVIVARAYDKLPPLLREWAAERPNVHEHLGLRPGIDFTPAPDLVDWPNGKPLPPPDTALGAQARLSIAGHACGPHTGEWNEPTIRALKHLQLELFIAPTGAIDEETLAALQDIV